MQGDENDAAAAYAVGRGAGGRYHLVQPLTNAVPLTSPAPFVAGDEVSPRGYDATDRRREQLFDAFRCVRGAAVEGRLGWRAVHTRCPAHTDALTPDVSLLSAPPCACLASQLHALAQDCDINLSSPAILVVGQQTDGKSALIEALMGFNFNHVRASPKQGGCVAASPGGRAGT